MEIAWSYSTITLVVQVLVERDTATALPKTLGPSLCSSYNRTSCGTDFTAPQVLIEYSLHLGLNRVEGAIFGHEITRAIGIGEVTIGVCTQNELDRVTLLLLPQQR